LKADVKVGVMAIYLAPKLQTYAIVIQNKKVTDRLRAATRLDATTEVPATRENTFVYVWSKIAKMETS
jgi:hypothetical protein